MAVWKKRKKGGGEGRGREKLKGRKWEAGKKRGQIVTAIGLARFGRLSTYTGQENTCARAYGSHLDKIKTQIYLAPGSLAPFR